MAFFEYFISVTGDCTNTGQGAITLSFSGGNPPYSVEWITPLQADFVDTIEPVTVTNLYPDTYIVRVNDSTLPENQEFFINIPVSSGVCGSIVSVTPATCDLDNGVVIATSTSLFSSTEFFLYQNDDTFVTSALTNNSEVEFINLSAGTYYLIVQDLGGCTAKTQSFIVQESTPLNFGFYVVPNASCGTTPLGKLFITGLTGTPPFEYLWSNSQTGDTITGLTAGLYSVQVTSGDGCQLSKTAEIVDIDPIGLGAFSASSPTCLSNNGAVTITITGGTEPYLYSASTGEFTISYSKSFTINNLYAGQYDFLVKDAAFCSIFEGVTLSAPTGINYVDVTTQNSTCSSNDGLILTVVNGGTAPFTYTLISSEGTQNYTNALSTYTFTGLSSGTYTVAVQDMNGCGFSQTVSLIAENKFTISNQTTGTTCNLNNGSINTIVSTGFTSPLDYSLDGQQVVVDTTLTSVTFSNLSFGQHTVQVTDATGCVQTKQVYVNSSQPLIYSLYSTSCLGGNNGTITSFISSGTPPFVFDWSDNVQGNPQTITVTGLSAGTYSVTITDSDGCSTKRDAIITCDKLYTSYQSYVMGEEIFNIDSPTKCGLIQMFNDGFIDLTSENTGCNLVSATFTANVIVTPLNVAASENFFTSTSLQSVPTDEEWYLVVKTLLYTIPGVGKVTIDNGSGKITIQTIPGNTILNGQEIIVELKINYEINCEN